MRISFVKEGFHLLLLMWVHNIIGLRHTEHRLCPSKGKHPHFFSRLHTTPPRLWLADMKRILKTLFFLFYKILSKIYWFERERNGGGGEKHWLVIPLIHASIGWFLYVPWLGIELATLAYWDDALANWAAWPEPSFPSFLSPLPFEQVFNHMTSKQLLKSLQWKPSLLFSSLNPSCVVYCTSYQKCLCTDVYAHTQDSE